MGYHKGRALGEHQEGAKLRRRQLRKLLILRLGGGDPFVMYQPYIDGENEIAEINAEYMERYAKGRQVFEF